jgi:transposase
MVAPIGRRGIDQLLAAVADAGDRRVPAEARLCLKMLAAQLAVLKEQILEIDRRIRASARETELGRRLMEVPGSGPLLASAFIATAAGPAAFKTGRDLSAWIGLVPKQNSSGGEERLGSNTKAVASDFCNKIGPRRSIRKVDREERKERSEWRARTGQHSSSSSKSRHSLESPQWAALGRNVSSRPSAPY